MFAARRALVALVHALPVVKAKLSRSPCPIPDGPCLQVLPGRGCRASQAEELMVGGGRASATVGNVGQMGHVFLLMGIKKFLLKTNK